MDPQFEALANHIADDVEQRFSRRFDAAEQRLSKSFADAEARLTRSFAEAEKRLAKNFAEAEKRLSDGAKMNMEDLRATVKGVAEGYGATLDRIERQLIELNGRFEVTIADHENVLKDHASRIATLEQRDLSGR